MKVEIEDDQERESAFRLTMSDGLRPLTKLNYFLGVSTFTFSPSGHIQYTHKTFTKCRVFLTLILLSVSATITVYRMVNAVMHAKFQSGIPHFNRMVELICQFISNLGPLMLILISLFKSNALDGFFHEMGKYNAGISEFAEPPTVRNISRKYLGMHLVLTGISGSAIVVRMFMPYHPDDASLRYLATFTENEDVMLAVTSVISVLLIILKHSAMAFIECFNLLLAVCFSTVTNNLGKFIDDRSEGWKRKYMGKNIKFAQ